MTDVVWIACVYVASVWIAFVWGAFDWIVVAWIASFLIAPLWKGIVSIAFVGLAPQSIAFI